VVQAMYTGGMTEPIRFHYAPLHQAGEAPWKDDLWLPRNWEVIVDDRSLLHLVTLRIVMEDRVPILDSVSVHRRAGGPPVTHRAMRPVRVSEYLQQACRVAAMTRTRDGNSVSYEPAFTVDQEFEIHPDLTLSGPSRPTRITEAHLAEVAECYNDAVAAGSRTPRLAVQNDSRWGPVPAQTAARWIRLAKDRELIKDQGIEA
jgi:hypothetical protein